VKKLLFLPVALVALAVLGGACGPVSSYAATVNGERLSQQSLTDELEAIRDNKDYAQAVEQALAQGGEKLAGSGKNTFDAGFVAQVLTRQIFLELVAQELKDRKIEVKPADLDKARKDQEQQFEQQFEGKKVWEAFPESYRDTLVLRSAQVNVLQEALSKAPDEAAIKAYYDEHVKEFEATCTRHILASFPGDRRSDPSPPPPDVDAATKAKAQGWKDRIDKGEDFAAMAKAESGDTGSGARGGDLGCEGGFVQEFTDAVNGLQPGQTSGPVMTQFGYHIIQVVSRKQKTLEEAKPQIEQTLSQESQNAVQGFLEEAVEKANVKINPKYGKFDKGDPAAGTPPRVVPPEGPATTTTAPADGVPGLAPNENEGETPTSAP
jgi:parvulin-like peptidyl-prolyl isomerase